MIARARWSRCLTVLEDAPTISAVADVESPSIWRNMKTVRYRSGRASIARSSIEASSRSEHACSGVDS
jgi:hypothetical protein